MKLGCQALFVAGLVAAAPTAAQEIVGCDRSSFGSVVLSGNQFGGIELEQTIGSYNNESIRNYSSDTVFSVAFSRDGRQLVVAGSGLDILAYRLTD